MSDYQRFYGPIMTIGDAESAFGGPRQFERTSAVRELVFDMRSHWHESDSYNSFKLAVRQFVRAQHASAEFWPRLEELLASFNDYADTDIERPSSARSVEKYPALEIYCSEDGYNALYRVVKDVLRRSNSTPEQLRTAAVLVEFLTIELYNLRLSNLADDRYGNFQGITYRGMAMNEQTIGHFRTIAEDPNLTKRNFSIPFDFLSSTTERSVMLGFAQREEAEHQMLWKIHIHGVEPKLLARYRQRYPDSVVTSICAMPVGRISMFSEKEILLRGPMFHIISMKIEILDRETHHHFEVLMLNVNRDHTTELGSNEGSKKEQRDFFRLLTSVSRYEICARLVRPYSLSESREYERLAKDALHELDSLAHAGQMYSEHLADEVAFARSTWTGCTNPEDFPQVYVGQRRTWHRALASADWVTTEQLLGREYDWHQAEWFNVFGFPDSAGSEDTGWTKTLLHHLATHNPPSAHDSEQMKAWEKILTRVNDGYAWKSLKTIDQHPTTAADIAHTRGLEHIASTLEPLYHHNVADSIIADLEQQFHDLMHQRASIYLDNFIYPQLSVLLEMEVPELWIPIPRSYGGFLIRLDHGTLHVNHIQTVKGRVGPKYSRYHLRPGQRWIEDVEMGGQDSFA